MLKRYSKKGFKLDNRLPVTLPILERIMSTARNITSSHCETCLFRAMCTTAFFESRWNDCQWQKIFQPSLTIPSGFQALFSFTFYWGNVLGTINTIITKGLFPLLSIAKWLGLVQFNASLNILIRVITPREHFSSFVMVKLSLGILILSSSAIKQCGLEPAQFKGHSFRIGATSHAATLGSTDSQIRVLGHWKSNASRKYIRIDSFSA